MIITDPLGTVQEIGFWSYKQIVYAQTRIHQTHKDFEIQIDLPISARKSDLV